MKIAGLSLAGPLAAGVAIPHTGPIGHNPIHKMHRAEVVKGVFESGNFLGRQMTVKAADGHTYTIDLLPGTRVHLEAQGSVSSLASAMSNHEVFISALVEMKNNTLDAMVVSVNLNTGGYPLPQKPGKPSFPSLPKPGTQAKTSK